MYFLTDQCNVMGQPYFVKVYGQPGKCSKIVHFHNFFSLTELCNRFEMCFLTIALVSVKARAAGTNIAELHTFKCSIKHVYHFYYTTPAWLVWRYWLIFQNSSSDIHFRCKTNHTFALMRSFWFILFYSNRLHRDEHLWVMVDKPNLNVCNL